MLGNTQNLAGIYGYSIRDAGKGVFILQVLNLVKTGFRGVALRKQSYLTGVIKMADMGAVPEKDATGEIKDIYEDIKRSLQLPFVPEMFQSFAVYPSFLQFIWGQLKQSVLTEQFYNDAARARGFAETFVAEAHIPAYKHEDALANGISVKDLVGIQTTLEAFQYENPKLLLIGEALYMAIGGITVGGNGDPASAHDSFGNRVIRKIDISTVEENTAPDNVRAIYSDIKATTGAPIIRTDFKAIASWPGFLRLAWDDLKIFMAQPSYNQGKESLAEFGQHASDRLAYPIKMGWDEMEAAGVHEEDFDAIEDAVRQAAQLIPELMLDVEEMRQVTLDLLEVGRGEYIA